MPQFDCKVIANNPAIMWGPTLKRVCCLSPSIGQEGEKQTDAQPHSCVDSFTMEIEIKDEPISDREQLVDEVKQELPINSASVYDEIRCRLCPNVFPMTQVTMKRIFSQPNEPDNAGSFDQRLLEVVEQLTAIAIRPETDGRCYICANCETHLTFIAHQRNVWLEHEGEIYPSACVPSAADPVQTQLPTVSIPRECIGDYLHETTVQQSESATQRIGAVTSQQPVPSPEENEPTSPQGNSAVLEKRSAFIRARRRISESSTQHTKTLSVDSNEKAVVVDDDDTINVDELDMQKSIVIEQAIEKIKKLWLKADHRTGLKLRRTKRNIRRTM